MGNGTTPEGESKKNATGNPPSQNPPQQNPPPRPPASAAYDLPDSLFKDGELSVGVEIRVTASGKQSSIMIPDVTKINKGEPVYITGRVEVHGDALIKLLAVKAMKLPPEITNLINDTTVTCDAFYYSTNPVEFVKPSDKYTEVMTRLGFKDDEAPEWKAWLDKHKKDDKYVVDEGPILMIFSIDFKKGLISDLTKQEHLADLFDVTGGSIRVVRCPQSKIPVLKEYLKQLKQAS